MMPIRTMIVAVLLLLPMMGFAAEPPGESSQVTRSSAEPSIAITELIARVAKRSSTQFVLDPRVRADVPLAGLDVERVDYDRLLAILRVNGLVAVPEKGFVVVVPAVPPLASPAPSPTGLARRTLAPDAATHGSSTRSAASISDGFRRTSRHVW